MENKLYVGNLPYAASEEDIKTHFSQAGTVTSVALITDRASGRAKGFGFVEMSSAEEAQKAISMFNGQSMGQRELKVSLARPREEGGRGGGGGGYGGRGGGGGGYGGRGGGAGGGGRRNDRGGGGGRGY